MDISQYNLTPFTWFLAIVSAMIIGLSKAGLSSISLITVTTLAYVFGAKSSTGLLLPMLSMADILAVWYYHRDTQWKYLIKLMPSMIVGVLIGVWIGKDLDEVIFKKSMAVLIILTVISMVWWERKKDKNVPQNRLFSNTMGLGAGIATMIGNMAGVFSNLYFLAMQLPKTHFIGTAAWLFLIINLFKIPFHIFVWHTISTDSFGINLILFPFLAIGFFIGVKIIKNINEERFRKMILIITAVAALFLLLSI
jgi:uncharacterized protein